VNGEGERDHILGQDVFLLRFLFPNLNLIPNLNRLPGLSAIALAKAEGQEVD
jgi:hypothetical protein